MCLHAFVIGLYVFLLCVYCIAHSFPHVLITAFAVIYICFAGRVKGWCGVGERVGERGREMERERERYNVTEIYRARERGSERGGGGSERDVRE